MFSPFLQVIVLQGRPGLRWSVVSCFVKGKEAGLRRLAMCNADSDWKDSVVGETPGLFLLRRSRCGCRGRSGRERRRDRRILRVGCGIVQSSGVLEDAAGVNGDGLDAGGLGGNWRAGAPPVGARRPFARAAPKNPETPEQRTRRGYQ